MPYVTTASSRCCSLIRKRDMAFANPAAIDYTARMIEWFEARMPAHPSPVR
jgi:hypothetical protein